MGPWERDHMIEKLAALKIHQDDVKYVVCSHGHPDHIGNLNLFLKSERHFVGVSNYIKDQYYSDCFTQRVDQSDGKLNYFHYSNEFLLDRNCIIKSTPGHTGDDITLVMNNCEGYGKVALVGDLFECQQDIENENLWLNAGSMHPDTQRFHRRTIYESVDWIIPGHGNIFKTRSDILL